MGHDTTWYIVNLPELKQRSPDMETLLEFLNAVRAASREESSAAARKIELPGRNDIRFNLGFSNWSYSSSILRKWVRKRRKDGSSALQRFVPKSVKVNWTLASVMDSLLYNLNSDPNYLTRQVLKKPQLKLKPDADSMRNLYMLADKKLQGYACLAHIALREVEADRELLENTFLEYITEDEVFDFLKLVTTLPTTRGYILVSQTY